MSETITLDPNYAAMFAQLIREVEPFTTLLIKQLKEEVPQVGVQGWTREDVMQHRRAQVETGLKHLNSLLYAIAISANSMTTEAQIVEFREVVGAALATANKAFRDFDAEDA